MIYKSLFIILFLISSYQLHGRDKNVYESEGKCKKVKAHLVGSKRPHEHKEKNPSSVKSKKASRLKNEWVSSKTYPKTPEAR